MYQGLTAIALLLLLMAFLTGCATVESGSAEDQLLAAGFQVRTPQNPEQQRIYDNLPAYEMKRGYVQGRLAYGYKDPRKGIVYVGGETQYAKYREIIGKPQEAPTYSTADDWGTRVPWDWYSTGGQPIFW